MSAPDLPQFRIDEEHVPGGLRLTLVGELDIAVADALTERLRRLRGAGERVRIDLSRLEFIDVRGFIAIRDAVHAGRSPRGDLVELEPGVTRPVQRLFDVLGVPGEPVAQRRGS